MITDKEIKEKIAEYQGKKDISTDECVKLSAFYTLKKEMFPEETDVVEIPRYSNATAPDQFTYDSGTEFSNTIQGMNIDDILFIFDDLMKATFVYNRGLYNSTIRELKNLTLK